MMPPDFAPDTLLIELIDTFQLSSFSLSLISHRLLPTGCQLLKPLRSAMIEFAFSEHLFLTSFIYERFLRATFIYFIEDRYIEPFLFNISSHYIRRVI
jgi:hypothetical protein